MYLALQQGVVDGAELPTDCIYEYSIFEVSKYFNPDLSAPTGRGSSASTNGTGFLKPEHQKAIQEAAQAGTYNASWTRRCRALPGQTQKAGIQFV